MWVIISFFIILGGLLPFVEDEFTGSSTSYDGTRMANEVGTSFSILTGLTVIGSIAKMFLWTFGAIHWMVDLIIFVPMRLMLLWLLTRAVRGI